MPEFDPNYFGWKSRQLIDDAVADGKLNELVEALFRRAVMRDPARPCRYAYDCVVKGRCPFDPCCNN